MYAVIETGGKQYRVEVGTELEVELLQAEPGDNITLDRVLLVADGDESTIGTPVVSEVLALLNWTSLLLPAADTLVVAPRFTLASWGMNAIST